MLKLVGAEVFLVSIQPAEKELQASDDDHAGPLHIEGESVPVRLPAQQRCCPVGTSRMSLAMSRTVLIYVTSPFYSG